jgi:hypothetical protein
VLRPVDALDAADRPAGTGSFAAHPSLNEILANQVTRIEAQPSAFELLSFFCACQPVQTISTNRFGLTRCDRSTLIPAKVTNEARTA